MYIDDCVYGTQMVAEGESANLSILAAPSWSRSTNLSSIVEDIAGVS